MDAFSLPAGATLITGNIRLSRQWLRDDNASRSALGERLWESPAVFPLEGWLRNAWEARTGRDPSGTAILLDAQQERVLWAQAIQNSPEADALLSISSTAAMAAEAWKLLNEWELPRTRADFDPLPDTAAFFGWAETVERKLRANHWLTSAELTRSLLADAATVSSPRQIYYAGFDELTPAQRRLFSALRARELPGAGTIPGLATRTGFESTAQELLHAAMWAREKLGQSLGGGVIKIGVVVRGLAAVRDMAERTFNDVLHPGLSFRDPTGDTGSPRAFHISAGPPLAHAPLIATALLVLRLHEGLSLAEAGMLVRSPFVTPAGATASPVSSLAIGSAVDAEWRDQGLGRITHESSAIVRMFPKLGRAFETSLRRMAPSQWSKFFSQLLARAGWPGPRPLSTAEYQAAERWNKLLSDFARLDLVLRGADYGDALDRLRRMAAETAFTPDDQGDSPEELAPVQIMDVLEAAGSSFDFLWVAGLHAGAWPQPPHPNPFLPLNLQRAAAVPHCSAARELSYAQAVTSRLVRSAPEIIFSYPKFSREQRLRVSPLIEAFPEHSFASGSIPRVTTSIVQALYAARPSLEILPLGAAPALTMGAHQHGGTRVLQDQAACQFRAFANHRLDTCKLEVPVPGLSPKERGLVIHAVLERLWNKWNTQAALNESSPAEISALLQKSIQAALKDTLKSPRDASLTQSQRIEAARLQALIGKWLEVERQRPPFEVLSIETRKTAELGGLTFSVKADRVDRYLSGQGVAILDYKTSRKLSSLDWESDRPDAPQLPLYAIQMTDLVSVLYAQLIAGETRFWGISEAGEKNAKSPRDTSKPPRETTMSEKVREWREVLERLASGFREGDAAVNPKRLRETCRYCDLGALCRVAEINRDWVEDEDQDEADG